MASSSVAAAARVASCFGLPSCLLRRLPAFAGVFLLTAALPPCFVPALRRAAMGADRNAREQRAQRLGLWVLVLRHLL